MLKHAFKNVVGLQKRESVQKFGFRSFEIREIGSSEFRPTVLVLQQKMAKEYEIQNAKLQSQRDQVGPVYYSTGRCILAFSPFSASSWFRYRCPWEYNAPRAYKGRGFRT